MNKINLGCGWECRDGWLNVDNTQKPQKENYPIEFMDVTKTWPYEDNYFDYALSEHMIEHIRDKDKTNTFYFAHDPTPPTIYEN